MAHVEARFCALGDGPSWTTAHRGGRVGSLATARRRSEGKEGKGRRLATRASARDPSEARQERWEALLMRSRERAREKEVLKAATDPKKRQESTGSNRKEDERTRREEAKQLRREVLEKLRDADAYSCFAALRSLSGSSAREEHYISHGKWDEDGLRHDLRLALRRADADKLRAMTHDPKSAHVEEEAKLDPRTLMQLRSASRAARGDAQFRNAAQEFDAERRAQARREELEKEEAEALRSRGSRLAGRPGFSNTAMADAMEEALRKRRARNLAALELERAEEKDAQAREQQQWPLKKLQNNGLVLAGIKARVKGQLFREAVVELSLPGGADLPYHKFLQGDNVALRPFGGKLNRPKTGLHRGWTLDKGMSVDIENQGSLWEDGAKDELVVEGIVLEVKAKILQVTVPTGFARELSLIPAGTLWRLDRGSDSATYRRAVDAVQRLGAPRTGSDGEKNIQLILAADEEFPDLCGPARAAAKTPIIPSIAQAGWKEKAVKCLSALELNHSQKSAVQAALNASMTLWQGPPGTGKTRTLLGFIEVVCGLQTAGPVLASSGTNAAVDNIVEGLLARGIDVLRMGQPAKIRASVRQASLEARIAQTNAGREAMKLRNEAEFNIFKAMRTSQEESVNLEAQARDLNARAQSLEQAAAKEVLETVQVVAATCAGAGESRLMHHNFKIVVLDEATQATEPQTLIPLTKGAECVVMAGDPRQLPPTVTSQAALEAGLGETLFEKIQRIGLEPHLLDTQYRMHSSIQAFPSMQFYGGQLKSGILDADRPPPRGFPWPNKSMPVCFVNCSLGEEKHAEGGTSYQNVQEAKLVVTILNQMIQEGVSREPRGAAILTPYAGQVRLLKAVASSMEEFSAVEISSIDGYQGRETEVVLFSAVRSNKRNAVGFLADARRLNVAITRAKRGLVVVGNKATLRSDQTWSAWLDWVECNGLQLEEGRFNGRTISYHGPSYSLIELQAMARRHKIRGFSKLRKGELLELLKTVEEQTD
eukprot:scaffold1440_cov332-Pavlova_lutheri.AAC.33